MPTRLFGHRSHSVTDNTHSPRCICKRINNWTAHIDVSAPVVKRLCVFPVPPLLLRCRCDCVWAGQLVVLRLQFQCCCERKKNSFFSAICPWNNRNLLSGTCVGCVCVCVCVCASVVCCTTVPYSEGGGWRCCRCGDVVDAEGKKNCNHLLAESKVSEKEIDKLWGSSVSAVSVCVYVCVFPRFCCPAAIWCCVGVCVVWIVQIGGSALGSTEKSAASNRSREAVCGRVTEKL